jgi:hypothetical protein
LTVFADEMRRDGIWSCPAIVLSQFDSGEYERSSEMRFMPAAFRAALHEHWSEEPSYEEDHAFALAVVRRLHERRVGLLLGTDSYLVVPGFSAIQELEYFVAAGLTPYEALQTGTINAARALHEQDTIGTVDVGKRADLLLLQGNPLTDVANVRKIVGVTLRGRWLPRSELQSRLDCGCKIRGRPLSAVWGGSPRVERARPGVSSHFVYPLVTALRRYDKTKLIESGPTGTRRA